MQVLRSGQMLQQLIDHGLQNQPRTLGRDLGGEPVLGSAQTLLPCWQ